MKKVAFAVALIFAFGVGSAYADFLGIGRFWEDVKREATNAAHNTEKTIGKAWEDTKREATNAANSDVGQVVQAVAVGVVAKVALNVVAAGVGEVIEVVANAL